MVWHRLLLLDCQDEVTANEHAMFQHVKIYAVSGTANALGNGKENCFFVGGGAIDIVAINKKGEKYGIRMDGCRWKIYVQRSNKFFNTNTVKLLLEDSHTCMKRKSMRKRKVLGEGIT